MAPPLGNSMLKYFTSNRRSKPSSSTPCQLTVFNPLAISSIGSKLPSPSQPMAIVDKGKRPMQANLTKLEPDLTVLETIPATAAVVATRKRTRPHEGNRSFRPEWASQFPWASPVIESSGECYIVKCIVCTVVTGRPRVIMNKVDNLKKHEGSRRAKSDMRIDGVLVKVGEKYTVPDCLHFKNEKQWHSRGLAPIPGPIVRKTDIRERNRKMTQFVVIFDMMCRGRPMSDYPVTHSLFQFLETPDLPKKHWCLTSGWSIAESCRHIVNERTKDLLSKANYFAVSADEVTSIDNEVWISIHVYVMQRNARTPILLSLKRVAGGCTSDNISSVIFESLVVDGGLTVPLVAKKFISFGADGASVFFGAKIGVTTRLIKQRAPYMIGQHCVAHRTNLAITCLSTLPIVVKIEKLCGSLYTYFSKSPRRRLEFTRLADELDTSGNKILRNVKTRWISMLAPMVRVLDEYKTLVAKMSLDLTTTASSNLDLLCDFETLIALPCLIPLLQIVNDLVKFAQSRHVYVCDFVAGVKLYQAELFRKFVDPLTSFQRSDFPEFCDLVHDNTHVVDFEWVTDLETHQEFLSMRILDSKFPCHWMGGSGSKNPLAREDFVAMVVGVKQQCKEAAQILIVELDHRFPDVDVINALGVVFPQSWLDPNCHEMFPLHFEILKRSFATEKSFVSGVGKDRLETKVKEPLCSRELDKQSSIFKSTMISNSGRIMSSNIESNPLTLLWNKLAACGLLVERQSEWFKVAEIAIVTVIGSVEDERTFSNLLWIKSKVRNRLGSHLDCTLALYSQSYYSLATFPYDEAIAHWEGDRERRGLGY